jgi:ribosomal protein S11
VTVGSDGSVVITDSQANTMASGTEGDCGYSVHLRWHLEYALRSAVRDVHVPHVGYIDAGCCS